MSSETSEPVRVNAYKHIISDAEPKKNRSGIILTISSSCSRCINSPSRRFAQSTIHSKQICARSSNSMCNPPAPHTHKSSHISSMHYKSLQVASAVSSATFGISVIESPREQQLFAITACNAPPCLHTFEGSGETSRS